MRINPPHHKAYSTAGKDIFPEHSLVQMEHAIKYRRRIAQSEIDPERAAAVNEIVARIRARKGNPDGIN